MKNSKKPFFIDGWITYISALKLLWEELETQYDFKFLRTRNLSQDCLEHFFSVIRWRNGNNNHPDPSQFESAYKAVVINQLLVPKKVGNVVADVSKHIVGNDEVRKLDLVPRQRSRMDADLHLENFEGTTIDENQMGSIHWTTGWACSKLKHAECIERVSSGSDDVHQECTAFTDFKKYNDRVKIQQPGVKVLNYFKEVTQIFEQNFERLLEADTVGVKEELMDMIQEHFAYPTSCSNQPPELSAEVTTRLIVDTLCTPCALMITEKFFNMLICGKLRTMNDEFKANMEQKKKNRRDEKAKKLNISRLSQLYEDSSSMHHESKKKKKSF